MSRSTGSRNRKANRNDHLFRIRLSFFIVHRPSSLPSPVQTASRASSLRRPVRDSYKSSSEKCLTNERKKERYFGRNCWYLKSGRSRVVLEARCNCNDSCRSGIAAICKRTGGLFPRFRKHRPICRFSPNPLPTLSPVGGSVHH